MIDPELLFDMTSPNVEAAAFIRGKTAVAREVFDKMLPELKARCFTVAGLESANTIRLVRDRLAELPEGGDWESIKKDIVAELSPYLSDEVAEKRADMLIRIHGFQAYQATQWTLDQRTKDTHPYYLYRTAQDDAVRDSHSALDGIILPMDDPFWDTHYPPWDWGCRCEVIAISEDDAQAAREQDAALPPDQRKVIEGGRLEQLHEGWLMNGPSARIDIRSDAERGTPGAFKWNPGDMRIPLENIRERYDEETWNGFVDYAKRQEVQFPGTEDPRPVWNWLLDGEVGALENTVAEHTLKTGHEAAMAINLDTAKRLSMVAGTADEVDVRAMNREMAKGGRWSVIHSHPDASSFSGDDFGILLANKNIQEIRMVSGMGEHILVKTPAFYESGNNGDSVYANAIARRYKLLYNTGMDTDMVSEQLAKEIGVDYVRIGYKP